MADAANRLISNGRTDAEWGRDALLLARWADNATMKQYHIENAISHLEEAIVVARSALNSLTEAPHVATNPTVDPDSGRPSLVEPAATSELFGNFGG